MYPRLDLLVLYQHQTTLDKFYSHLRRPESNNTTRSLGSRTGTERERERERHSNVPNQQSHYVPCGLLYYSWDVHLICVSYELLFYEVVTSDTDIAWDLWRFALIFM